MYLAVLLFNGQGLIVRGIVIQSVSLHAPHF
jgi:hypothetical protein